jgi:hypothetical protein
MRNCGLALLALLLIGPANAEILDASTNYIRVRLGDNNPNATNTVIYEAGIPGSLGGLPGVTAAPQTISTTSIAGGSGVFQVQLTTDINARGSVTPLTGMFTYDSSQPMTCVTPTTCGTADIPFTRISWNLRDSDTHTTVSQYDGTANQLAQLQTDTDPANNRADTRHRNYLQFVFDNAELLPAGTYEGTVTLNGNGQY